VVGCVDTPEHGLPIMKTLVVSIAAVAVVVLGPAASAVTVVDTEPASGFISITPEDAACLGEDVTFTGTVHIVARFTESASGHVGTAFVIVLRHVVGTGTRTGDTYHIVGTYKELQSTSGSLLEWTFNVVGGREGRIFGHLLMNRRGDVLAERYLCR
jgi:hypothetical protein